MGPRPDYWGHRKRLRRKFLEKGLYGFLAHEILEFILTFSLTRRDTKALATALVRHFGSLAGVMDASREDLLIVPGVGPRSALLLSLFKPTCIHYLKERAQQKNLMNSPQAVASYCRMALSGQGHESVRVFYLNARNHLITEQTISEGSIDRAEIYPRRIIEEALKCHAASFILVHNHPSGHVAASPEDKELTQKLAGIAQHMELDFLDHLIVGREGYFSFRQQGLL